MKRLIRSNNVDSYILTEAERVSLADKTTKELLQRKLNNIEKYAECKVDFFTDREVEENNKWYFIVEKNGSLYICIYDNERIGDYKEEEERKLTLLLWRYNDIKSNTSYIEIIGNYIDEEGTVYTVNDTGYNDCRDIEEKYYDSIIEVELNNTNKAEVLRRFTT